MSIPKHLKEKIQSIPEKPGIYKMKDSHGNIIYIGKSKCLSKRVKSYFQSSHEWEKINRLVFNIKDIDFIVTDTHLEAQLLECTLIKIFKPIYNSQFVRDKNYVYLKIEDLLCSNSLSIVYNRDGEYTFGPFRSKYYIYDLITLLSKLYPIRKCNNTFEFQYNAIPISMDENQYNENKKSLIEIFTDMNSLEVFIDILKDKMEKASLSLHFEKASQYRDILLALEYLYKSHTNDITKDKEIIMGEKIDGGYKLFYISDGNLVLKRKFKDISVENLYEFIDRANILKDNRMPNMSEKSRMDFKSIINRELKFNYYKIVDEEFNANKFIKDLLKA